jgi:hypothetical protein
MSSGTRSKSMHTYVYPFLLSYTIIYIYIGSQSAKPVLNFLWDWYVVNLSLGYVSISSSLLSSFLHPWFLPPVLFSALRVCLNSTFCAPLIHSWLTYGTLSAEALPCSVSCKSLTFGVLNCFFCLLSSRYCPSSILAILVCKFLILAFCLSTTFLSSSTSFLLSFDFANSTACT